MSLSSKIGGLFKKKRQEMIKYQIIKFQQNDIKQQDDDDEDSECVNGFYGPLAMDEEFQTLIYCHQNSKTLQMRLLDINDKNNQNDWVILDTLNYKVIAHSIGDSMLVPPTNGWRRADSDNNEFGKAYIIIKEIEKWAPPKLISLICRKNCCASIEYEYKALFVPYAPFIEQWIEIIAHNVTDSSQTLQKVVYLKHTSPESSISVQRLIMSHMLGTDHDFVEEESDFEYEEISTPQHSNQSILKKYDFWNLIAGNEYKFSLRLSNALTFSESKISKKSVMIHALAKVVNIDKIYCNAKMKTLIIECKIDLNDYVKSNKYFIKIRPWNKSMSFVMNNDDDLFCVDDKNKRIQIVHAPNDKNGSFEQLIICNIRLGKEYEIWTQTENELGCNESMNPIIYVPVCKPPKPQIDDVKVNESEWKMDIYFSADGYDTKECDAYFELELLPPSNNEQKGDEDEDNDDEKEPKHVFNDKIKQILAKKHYRSPICLHSLCVGEQYIVRIKCINQDGIMYSDIWEPIQIKMRPTQPIFVSSKALDRSVHLKYECPNYQWAKGYHPKYEIRASRNNDKQTFKSTATSIKIDSLRNGRDYTFKVRAKNEFGQSEWSQNIRVTPLKKPHQPTQPKQMTLSKFVYPQKSDYIQCAMKEHDISNCNVMKRIIHFLQIYEEYQSVNKSMSIYDYMHSLKGYDISHFLEDWYQVKMNHLNDEKNFDFLKDIINDGCDGSNQCKYVQRYARDREKDDFGSKGKDFDIRNFILMDQMDSIHSFLFHSMQRRRTFVPFGDIDDDDKKQQIVLPQSLNEFSVEQVVYVLDQHIFDKLKPKIKEKLQKHKEQIIDYIKDNKMNGNELWKMKRNIFINSIKTHLNDKKLTTEMSALYKELMAYQRDVIISSKDKFITAEKTEVIDDKKKKKEYYSFGEKYLYNPKLSNSALFVKPKYKSIKEELFQYYARANKDNDTTKLLDEQMRIINSMDEKLRPLLKELVNEQPITSSNVLWNKDIETSRKQLKEIIAKLCEYANVSNDDEWDESGANVATESMDIAFKVYAINKIQKALKMNKERYVNQPRVNVFIEKCNLKMKMGSIKRMKAAKNKNNNDYGIKKDRPISFDHVFALILYSQCTKLCTSFRFTYRRLKDESLKDYKKRHSLYANMGRLLFECFLFYASTNRKISVLYHGMNVELLFKNLECKFIAPTSTTTEESVACNFGRQGVVMKLESAESHKFIKCVDMALFTCFDNESEFFIFDYKLRIIDLFIPQIRCWIGKSIMNRLLLLDLLSNNVFVDNEQFLKEKTQNGLVEVLKCITNDTISTFTQYEFVNAFIESLITQNNGIKFNMKNTQSLLKKLNDIFTDKDCKNSPFQIQYQDKAISICKLRKQNEEQKENQEVAPKKLLDEWGLGEYWAVMEEEGWDDVNYWKDIKEDELKQMGFKSGHRRKFQQKANVILDVNGDINEDHKLQHIANVSMDYLEFLYRDEINTTLHRDVNQTKL